MKLVPQVSLAALDLRDFLVFPAVAERPVIMASKDPLVNPAPMADLDPWAPLGLADFPGPPALVVKWESEAQWARPDVKAELDLQGHQACPDSQARRAAVVRMVFREVKAHPDLQDPKVSVESPVSLACLVRPALRAQ